MKKAAFHNLGCKVNAYETEAMQQQLEENGYEIVPFSEKADVYVINTCAVTSVADRKSRQMIHRARSQNPAAVVVAAGCYVQESAGSLREDLAVDILLGNNRKGQLLEALREYENTGERESRLSDIGRESLYEPLRADRTGEHTRAYIKVQDGCNQFCSYCIIPYLRGRVRSRREEEILEETRALAARGYREVVLTGIHLSSYGQEDYREAGGERLLALIRQVQEVEGIRRIRLGSLEPQIITEAFAQELASVPKLCPHFHLSLQSGCGETLRRMNRHYTPQEYGEKCQILREAFDRPALTTDVIVGFPGETPEEFGQTEDFVAGIGFAQMHIFKYSRRKGTRADRMEGQVPEPEKASRSARLLKLSKESRDAYIRSLWGKETELLTEEAKEDGDGPFMAGHIGEYIEAGTRAGGLRPNEIVRGIFGVDIFPLNFPGR